MRGSRTRVPPVFGSNLKKIRHYSLMSVRSTVFVQMDPKYNKPLNNQSRMALNLTSGDIFGYVREILSKFDHSTPDIGTAA